MDGSGRSPLHWAAIMGQNDVMCLLLDHGASLDCRDPLGRTPLFSAAAFGQVTAVKLLLERGAEKDGQDSRGEKAIKQYSWDLYVKKVSLPQNQGETTGS